MAATQRPRHIPIRRHAASVTIAAQTARYCVRPRPGGGGGDRPGERGDPLRAFRRRASHMAPGRPVTRSGAPLGLGAVAFHQFEPSHSRHRVDQRNNTILTGVECTDMLPYKAVICRASLQAAAAPGTSAQQIFRHRRDSSCIFPLEFGAGLSKSADILPRGRTARPFQRLALSCVAVVGIQGSKK